MEILPQNHQWRKRVENTPNDYSKFIGEWLVDIEKQDISKPALGIINGWQARYSENQWYAEALKDYMSIYAYDSRGQGNSPKDGKLDAVQGAIDANAILTKSFDEYDRVSIDSGLSISNKSIQAHCAGGMSAAALFAGRFPIADRLSSLILLSPVNTFNLPVFIKPIYFLPAKLVRFATRYIAPSVINKVQASEESRRNAMQRLSRIDINAGVRQSKAIFWKENVEKYWKYVKVPTLIFVSRKDPVTTIEESKEVFDCLPFGIWWELKADDHFILESNIELIKKILPEFTSDPWGFYDKYKSNSPEI
ncbi:MAG: alpha/beta hydrolase [Candidatus Heimdallarchaeota archaeon]|nr:alpha/beta hydrolase [Candidatus Heimdallarchaeota archaeon]